MCFFSGAGNFGSVMKGVCRLGGKEIPVAVKTLKNADLEPGVQVRVCAERCMLTWRDRQLPVAVRTADLDPVIQVRVCAERCMLTWRQADTSGCEDG